MDNGGGGGGGGGGYSLTAHQHQKGHTVPKQVIMIATSIQVVTVSSCFIVGQ